MTNAVFPRFEIGIVAALLMLLVSPLRADLPTTSTLTLMDVFQIPGQSPMPVVEPDSLKAFLYVPDTNLWRVPESARSTPTPTPAVPEDFPIPRLPLLIAKERTVSAPLEREAFDFRGVTLQTRLYPDATVLIRTQYQFLRCEYRLEKREATKDFPATLVFYHGPGTEESFRVPRGSYRLVRRLWREDDTSRAIEEIYPYQTLESGGQYEFVGRRDEEQRLLSDLRDSARKR